MCRQLAKAHGYNVNGFGKDKFAGDYKTKGCFAYGSDSE
jgi:hypothetical protein